MKNMRGKMTGLMALLCACLLLLCGCGEKKTQTDLAAQPAAVTAAPAAEATEEPAAEVTEAPAEEKTETAAQDIEAVVKQTAEAAGGLTEMPAALILEMIGLEADMFDKVLDYESEDGLGARCVILLCGKTEEDAATAKTALERYLAQRMKETENYLPDEYAKLKKSEVRQQGSWVYLIVDVDAAAIEAALK